jgi:hypothetical protein
MHALHSEYQMSFIMFLVSEQICWCMYKEVALKAGVQISLLNKKVIGCYVSFLG